LRLLIVRHARAVPRGTRGVSDDERPLTKEGAAEFGRCARGLARVIEPPDVFLTSPLPRARRTAEIARAAWESRGPVVEEPALADAALAGVLRRLKRHRGAETLAVFGHEPILSALLAHLVGARNAQALTFKKGGAALVETSNLSRNGAGRLLWFLPPRLLQSLGGGR
jgi:phosphohistidine phosphatase